MSFLLKILLWVFISFLFGKVCSKSTANTLDETLTQQINSKQSNFRTKLKTLISIKLANIMLLGHLFVFQGHISSDPSSILPCIYDVTRLLSNDILFYP